MSGRWRLRGMVLASVVMVAASACGTGTPDSPEARRARGLELINLAGKQIRSAQTLSFKAVRTGERVRRNGEKMPVVIEQTLQVRRPDRMHLKASGDLDLELFYDGTRITLMSHAQKVYGAVEATGPLDVVIPDAIDRYDIPFPLSDMVTFTSAEQLVDEQTEGGWEENETIDGRQVARIAWQHPNTDWTVWIATEGQTLPVRLDIHYKALRGSPHRSFELSDWQFGAELPDSVFAASVPPDYEGIPVIQRASAVHEEIEKAREGTAPQAREKP